MAQATNRFYYLALLFIAAVLGYLTYQIISPFLSAVGWAIVLTIVFYPIFDFFLKYLRWKPLATVVTVLLILLLILGPFSYLGYLLAQEVGALLGSLEAGKLDPVKTLLQHPMISGFVKKLLVALHMTQAELEKAVIDGMTGVGRDSITMIRSGAGNVVSFALNFVLMILSIFFLLAGGPELLEKLGSYLPFSRKEREKLMVQTKDIVVSTIYGGVVVAVVQGLIGGIAYSILGMSSPVVWGLSIFVTSFIPMVGTFIVWGPTAGYLMLTGSVVKGATLFVIGAVAISSADNILRPLIVKGKMKMPILAIFFSILGGIKFFGFIGFILGPLVVAIFLSVLDIMRHIEEPKHKDVAEGQ